MKRRETHNHRTSPVLAAAVMLALTTLTAMGVQAQRPEIDAGVDGRADGMGSDAEIDVDWTGDGLGFDVASSKDLSNVIVELCDGSAHKHEQDEFGEDPTEWSHSENQDIFAIWVKSGDNHDPEGPAPPPPFDNAGAGEYFENPNGECEEPECRGPRNVTATAFEDHILVEWSAFGTPDEYIIYRQADDGPGAVRDVVPGDRTTYEDDFVEPGIGYTYEVTARTDGRESDRCSSDRAVVPEAQCVGPLDVTATALANESIVVTWTGVDGEDGYNVYRHDGDGSFEFVAHLGVPNTAYWDEDVTVGTTYTYTVTATADGESEACVEASATAIPVFPSVAAAAMALFVGAGAYRVLHRRR